MKFGKIVRMVFAEASQFDAPPNVVMEQTLKCATEIYCAQLMSAEKTAYEREKDRIEREERGKEKIKNTQFRPLPGMGECCENCWDQDTDTCGMVCLSINPGLAADGKSCRDQEPMHK